MAEHIMTDEEILEELEYAHQVAVSRAQKMLDGLCEVVCPNCLFLEDPNYWNMPSEPWKCEHCTVPDDIVECLSIIASDSSI